MPFQDHIKSLIGTRDGSANVIFLQPKAKFIQKLRKAKKLMVETEFYAEGPRQMTFRPVGLSW